MDIMHTADFQTQLTSIMETLAKTAVVEISKLFKENASFLRLEISRCTSENESLRKKCHFLENELQCARKGAGKMNGREALSCHPGLTDTGHRPAIDNVFGKEWCMNLWRHEESHVGEQEDTHLDSTVIIGEPVNLLEEESDMVMIKEEAFDDCSSGRNEEDQDTVKESNIQVDGMPNEMTLTPLSSNESIHEQPFIPSFIKSNWVRSFQVPWDRMPAALIQATSTGERARPGPRREFVRIVVAAMQAHCPNPNLAACGEVARNIVSTYPLTFGDISEEGEQLGNGFSCLQRQLKTRVEHVNRDVLEHRIRRPRRPSMKRAGEQDGYTMKRARCKVDSYGCINWQPSSIPEGETAESLEMKRKVAAEIFQSAGPKAAELPNVDDLMQQTYVYQRHMINSCPPPTISEIEGHWPFLFTERGLCRHFKILTGIDIRSRFNETLIDKSKRILNYFSRQRLKWSEEIQSMLSEIEDANATDNNRIAISAILLMMKYFKEKDNAVFILADETSTKMSIENEISLPATPRLIMLGETLLTSSKWFVSIEGRVTHSIEDKLDFAEALSVFFGCFYVFNIEYQESASATLELIQRFFVRINPEGTKCTSKSGTSRRTGSAVQRKPQNFNTRVATFMQRLSEFEWKTSS
ncbi:uncharacterized protein LOC113051193 isoform X1 [Carassius auratus]|uniref:Uncharacterized protein LOC113051193 isoform X1 n=2 Tax=Carassius auratus TaxID=7957 RepID=A0A6P6KFV0_CARAU|nr:uncharacterized protein LOC113051193 isoform X1 [Carassius auratus]